eukprot:gene6260-12674_t
MKCRSIFPVIEDCCQKLVAKDGKTEWKFNSIHQSTKSECEYPCEIKYQVRKGISLVSTCHHNKGSAILKEDSFLCIPVGLHRKRICQWCKTGPHKSVKIRSDCKTLFFCSNTCLTSASTFIDICGEIFDKLSDLSSDDIDDESQKDILYLTVYILYARLIYGMSYIQYILQLELHRKHQSPTNDIFKYAKILQSIVSGTILSPTDNSSNNTNNNNNKKTNNGDNTTTSNNINSNVNNLTLLENLLLSIRYNAQRISIPGVPSTSLLCISPTLSRLNHSCSPNTQILYVTLPIPLPLVVPALESESESLKSHSSISAQKSEHNKISTSNSNNNDNISTTINKTTIETATTTTTVPSTLTSHSTLPSPIPIKSSSSTHHRHRHFHLLPPSIRMVLIANRPVYSHEELCISYMSDPIGSDSASSRRNILHSSFHFQCDCQRCGDSDCDVQLSPLSSLSSLSTAVTVTETKHQYRILNYELYHSCMVALQYLSSSHSSLTSTSRSTSSSTPSQLSTNASSLTTYKNCRPDLIIQLCYYICKCWDDIGCDMWLAKIDYLILGAHCAATSTTTTAATSGSSRGYGSKDVVINELLSLGVCMAKEAVVTLQLLVDTLDGCHSNADNNKNKNTDNNTSVPAISVQEMSTAYANTHTSRNDYVGDNGTGVSMRGTTGVSSPSLGPVSDLNSMLQKAQILRQMIEKNMT